MTKLKTFVFAVLIALLLAGCGGGFSSPGDAGEVTASNEFTNPVDGLWRRTDMVVRRSAEPDQPVIEAPFKILGTTLILDGEEGLLIEQVTDQVTLGGETEGWSCELGGAYHIPVAISYNADNTSGTVSWTGEALSIMAATMDTPWQNICTYDPGTGSIPANLEDHAPLVSVPTLQLSFTLLDGGNTLALNATFEASQGEEGETVLIERAYLYERVR